ncbi:MAG: hypothetical protein KW802_04530, partial [Candidatus Doudnabacteria bacterium]|nr:hypothetical protein [Candidatus Doudnabacteria bacterium]
MKYIKPHLSPELRAQITPHSRRDLRFTTAGVFFLLISVGLFYNLWPKGNSPINDKASSPLAQSATPAGLPDKQVLGAATVSDSISQTQSGQFTEYSVKNGDTLFNISQKY